MKAITIRGIDPFVSEKLKQAAKTEGKSVNQLVLDLIKHRVGARKDKKFTKKHRELDHLFGKWSRDEFERIQGIIDSQRKIDGELWQ